MCAVLYALDFDRLGQNIVNIPTCSMDTCIMESIAVASITTICVLEVPFSMTYERYHTCSAFL
jgi:hypothetical protein